MDQKTTDKQRLTTLKSTHTKALVELETYKLLVESVEDYAIFLLDPNGIIISWNKGAERNKGYKPEEIIGKHFSNFYLPEDREARKPEKELEIAERVGRIEDEDWRVRKDGSRFWANVIITALHAKDGSLVGFAKVTRDLTERKRQEDEIRNSNVLLRKRREELEALNESKDQFISLASHQLRTPATAIKQLLGMLLDGFNGELSDEQYVFIQKAYESNERQIAIVNSLLKVALLDAGKVALRKEPTDIRALLRSVVDEQADSIEARRQTIIYDKQSTAPAMADVDPKYFRMALENLVDNASKYTHKHGTITLRTAVTDYYVIVSVKDNGVGIATEDLSQLFQKFKRLHNDLSQTVSGTGLGLYWVKEILNLHGATIEVESEPEMGTTFTIAIPRGETDA